MSKTRDLSQFITSINKKEEKVGPTKIVRYDNRGKPDTDKKTKLSDTHACAVEITSGQNIFYKIKAKRGGELYNPENAGMLYSLEVTDRISNKPMFEFKEVSQRTFEYYLNFLEKRQESLIKIAEREAYNG